MKITFNEKDTPFLLSQLNEKTFIGLVAKSSDQSSEKWGLPVFKNMTFKTESDIWKDARVKKAIEKVKSYANKKHFKFANPKQAQTAKMKLFSKLSKVDAVAKGLVATYKTPKFVKIGDVTLLSCSATFKQVKHNQKATAAASGVGVLAGASAVGIGGPVIAGAVVLGSVISYGLSKLLLWLTNRKKMGYYSSFIPFINNKNKLIWMEFGSFLVGDMTEDEIKTVAVSQEDLNSEIFSVECGDCDEGRVIAYDQTIGPEEQLELPEDEPPTTEVILDSSDEDGSETPVKDADETPVEIPMDEEATESFESLIKNNEDDFETEFEFI